MTLMAHISKDDEMPVIVKEVTKESVTLDGNHPLAGEELILLWIISNYTSLYTYEIRFGI